MTAKSPDAFRTISEVAEELDVPAHVLRFWESRFTQIKPVKRAGGRRYYRPEDIELIDGIKRLLHEHGMTIRGVQKLIKDHGIANIASLAGGVRQGTEAVAFAPFAKTTPVLRATPPTPAATVPIEPAPTAPTAAAPQAAAPLPVSAAPQSELPLQATFPIPASQEPHPGNLAPETTLPATASAPVAEEDRQYQQRFAETEGASPPTVSSLRPPSPLSGRIAGMLRRTDGERLRQVRTLLSPLATRLESLRERLATAAHN